MGKAGRRKRGEAGVTAARRLASAGQPRALPPRSHGKSQEKFVDSAFPGGVAFAGRVIVRLPIGRQRAGDAGPSI